ncbi:hypothetical protein WICMUC_000228 [Wickerhamomyces mucosus]|uniref:Alkyl transferase n=1 Tax=Wickerhamomyces mucosus TaxID=1378264 RepID=A0A9P8PY40_9ASCO|nr:hypothetical protein WICMUC_000228 [Wickerhamomyces mucosus]
MDGNRRFAKRENIELKEGHNAGFESMAKILEICYECGVKSATVFAFSIENFKRNKYEIDWLMELAKTRFTQMVEHGEICEQYGIKIKIIGDKSLLPIDVLKVLNEAERITQYNTRATLNVCFPYTSRYEITNALKNIVKENVEDLNIDQINEELIDNHLFTAGQPPLDLLIRTSGVSRLSDFLLWQVSSKGVEMEPLDILWPDLKPWHICWILIKFSFNKSYPKTYQRSDFKKID